MGREFIHGKATWSDGGGDCGSGTPSHVRERVTEILRDLTTRGDEAVVALSTELDAHPGPFVLRRSEIDHLRSLVPESLRRDIELSQRNVSAFAAAQRRSLADFEIEVSPGYLAGQRSVPVSAAGCYVPGGRYSHIASAVMTAATARAAGVGTVVVCTPPRPAEHQSGAASSACGEGIDDCSGGKGSGGGGKGGGQSSDVRPDLVARMDPAVVFAADLCGADVIACLGGVQAIGAMAHGLCGLPRADVLVGPGNAYVAEAKVQLFARGAAGIDMLAGPTDTMILADEEADPGIVAADLIGQAEHGPDSPAILATTCADLARKVAELCPRLAEALPGRNGAAASAAWRDFGAIVVVSGGKEGLVEIADEVAPEHLHVQCRGADLDFYKDNLSAYGSLFLGEEVTVPYGDKCAGPNHVLPTSGAARHAGGLSVHRFLKTITWQRAMSREASREVAGASARISRAEGMEGHARSSDVRFEKYGF